MQGLQMYKIVYDVYAYRWQTLSGSTLNSLFRQKISNVIGGMNMILVKNQIVLNFIDQNCNSLYLLMKYFNMTEIKLTYLLLF